jgi:predicted PurR-regulated permease PerM
MSPDRPFTYRLIQTVAAVTAAGLALSALWAARSALMLIYISALIAMGFSPLVVVIERRRGRDVHGRIPRWLAILSVYLAVVAVFVIVALLVIPPLVAQATALWDRVPIEFNRFQTFLIQYHLMTHRVTLEQAVQNAPSGTGGNAVGTVLVAISSVIGGLFGLITTLILSFYLLIEAEPMFAYVIRFVPAGRRGEARTMAREVVTKISAWLRAQLMLAGLMGTCTAVGLGLLGVPYFYVVALIAAIGEMIPIVGPVIGGIAAVAVAVTVSTKLAVIVGIYFLILHQLEANILVPKIMERRVGVSPVAVMAALLIGSELSGLAGAILAIPTAAILSVIVEEMAPDRGGGISSGL